MTSPTGSTPPPRRRFLRAVPDLSTPDPDDFVVPDLDEPGPGGVVEAAEWAVDLPETDDELDLRLDVDESGPVPVDPPASASTVLGTVLAGRSSTRRPIVPAWMRNRDERRRAGRWAAGHVAHVSAYHATRSPKYALRAAARTPRGAFRVVAGTGRWVFDREAHALRAEAVRAADHRAYLALSRQRNERVKVRAVLALTAAGLATAAAVLVALAAPAWAQLVTLALVVVVLARVGTNPDRPLTDVAAVVPRARRLTADVVERAFMAAGLASDKASIAFPAPITRDGPGWRAVIDLPYGVTADKAIKRRTDIAAGLDLDEVQVWPERIRGTAGSARRLALWVADEDPYATPSGAWPMAKRGQVDVFRAFPFGQDQRGREIGLALMFTSLLVGAIPRQGKTYAARLPVLAAALDPIVELHVYDGKGGQDWRPFAAVAHRVGFGGRDDVVTALLADLQAIQRDMHHRYDTLGALPAEVCPDSKVTRELAERRGLGLHPVVVAIDEFQRFSEHPTHGEAIVEALVDLAKIGPAVGIMLVLATQKPDTTAIPSRLRDVIGTRYALKCMTWQASDAVLGAGAYSAGYDASRFLRSHRGVGWLLGADDSGSVDDAAVVRTYLADSAAVAAVVERARALREAAGLLTGHAAGEQPEPEGDRYEVLVDVLGVWPVGEDRVWSDVLVERLAEAHPRYIGWTQDTLAGALKPFGISTRQMQKTIDGARVNRRGFDRKALTAALTDRPQVSTRPTRKAIDDGPDPDAG